MERPIPSAWGQPGGLALPGRSDYHREAARFRDRAARAAERATRTRTVAEHHERRAREERVELQPLHRSLARAHRESQERQLATCALYTRHAQRLEELAGRSGASPPRLIESVASGCGRCGAFVNLSAAGTTPMVVASDTTARAVHDVEVLLGEGPSLASQRDGPVLAGGDDMRRRWPPLAAATERLGVLAVAAVPLQVEDLTVGSLTAIATSPAGRIEVSLGELGAIGHAVLDELLFEVAAPGPDGTELLDQLDPKDELHQAVGVVMARCGCSIADAFALLRARAFSTETDLGSLAKTIISGDVRAES